MFFIIFGGPLPQFATAIWTASLYNRALSATEVKQLSFPENSIRRDSRGEGESEHHPMRCLRSYTCLDDLSPICSSRDAGLNLRTSFCVIS
jgi:hypothetical protein